MAKVTVKTPSGADAGSVDLDERYLRHRAERPGHAPGRHRAARRPPRRHAEHQDPGRGRVVAAPSRGSRRAPAAPGQGSIRAPQWKGGGVALGPKPRSYAQRTPKKMINLALRSALSDRAAEGKVIVVDEWGFDTPKTKDAVAALGRSASRAGSSWCSAATTTPRWQELPQPPRGPPHRGRSSSTPTTSSCSDFVVFTEATLPPTRAEAAEAPKPEAPSPSRSRLTPPRPPGCPKPAQTRRPRPRQRRGG